MSRSLPSDHLMDCVSQMKNWTFFCSNPLQGMHFNGGSIKKERPTIFISKKEPDNILIESVVKTDFLIQGLSKER